MEWPQTVDACVDECFWKAACACADGHAYITRERERGREGEGEGARSYDACVHDFIGHSVMLTAYSAYSICRHHATE